MEESTPPFLTCSARSPRSATLDNIPKRIARSEQNLQTVESQLEDAKVEVQKPFSKEADLKEKK